MLNKQLQEQIELEAKADAKKLTGRVPIFRMGYESGYYDGAEKYAELWQAAEQWKREAKLLLDPLLEWGQAQKDIPLGISITSEILRRAKLWQAAEAKAARYEKALKEIINQANFSPGNSWQDIAFQMKCVATDALTPKTSTDDTK